MARLLPLALLAVSLGLVLPSSALAVQGGAASSHRPPGGVYGGRNSQVHPMSLRLTRDGKRLRSWVVHVDVSNCSSSPTRSYSLALAIHLPADHPVRVGADGRFAERGRFRVHTQAGQELDFQVHLKGKTGRTRATGRIRISGPSDASGNVVDRCDSGPVRWSLRRGKVYGGATAEGTPLSIRLNHDGSRIKSFFIDLHFSCGSTDPLLSLNHLSVAVRRDGSFSKRGLSGIPLKLPGGATASGRFSLRGKLGRRRASGRYRALGTLRQPDGSRASCDTGTVRWTARRG